MRILWISECPQHVTGFGKVTHYITKGLRESGFDIVVSCFTPFAVLRHDNIPVYPYGDPLDKYINYIERRHGDIDVVVFHGAPWVPPLNTILPQVRNVKKKTIGYFVHEFIHAPRSIKDMFKYVHLLTVPTRYLAKVLGVDRYVVVPHGVNPNIWYPRSEKYDKFTVAMVASNHPRKRHDVFLHAVAMLLSRGYDVQVLPYTSYIGYWDIMQIKQSLEEYYNVKIDIVKPVEYDMIVGLPEHEQADVVCKSHVHALITGGEAWALPITETLACGLVNIATWHPALTEIYGSYMIPITARSTYISPSDGTLYLEPDVNELVEVLEAVIKEYDKLSNIWLTYSDAIRKQYSWDRALKHMIEAIDKVQEYSDPIIYEQATSQHETTLPQERNKPAGEDLEKQ